MSDPPRFPEPYRQSVEAVLAATGTDGQRSLSEEEAHLRLERHGFQDALVILLLVATAVSAGLWWARRTCCWRAARTSSRARPFDR